MKHVFFLRRPIRLLICIVLFALLSAAAMVFALQVMVDALVMSYSMDSAAYVGTVYSRLQEQPMLQELPDEVVSQLADSEWVSELFVRRTYSGKAEGLACVRDGFGTNESLNKRVFVEGTIVDKPMLSVSNTGILETFTLETTRIWGGNWDMERFVLHINRGWNVEKPQFEIGDRIFSAARYNSDRNGNVYSSYIVDPAVLETEFQTSIDSAVWNYGLLELPEEITDTEAYIESYLNEAGLQETLNVAAALDDVFTVYEVEDMSMLLTVADGTTFLTEGRELRSSDIGKKVCVINQAVADRNGLQVGNQIDLSLTDGCYISREETAFYDGLESGYPFEFDALLPYRDCGEYEIVGLYSEIERQVGRLDVYHFSRNDIFIPAGTLEGFSAKQAVRPCTLSFRVLGPDYEAFMDAFEVPLNEMGYTLSIVDTGWAALSSSFFAMQDRQRLMLGCAALACLAAVFLYVSLLHVQSRREFALCRLLGASPIEARGIYFSAFLCSGVPAGLLAVTASYEIYNRLLMVQAVSSLPVALPEGGQCIAMLSGWMILELAAAFLALLAVLIRSQRRSVLRLLS